MIKNKKIVVVISSMVIIGQVTMLKPYAENCQNIPYEQLYNVKNNVALLSFDNTISEAEILYEFNQYVNGSQIHDMKENGLKDKEILNLLEKYKDELNMPEEFYHLWKKAEKLEYASSVRALIKEQKENMKSLKQLQGYLDLCNRDMLVRLEARKLKAQPENPNYQRCYMRINRTDKDIDITDMVMAKTSEFRNETIVDILSVGQRKGKEFICNPNFEIQNKNGVQRIILKNVTREILTNELRVNIVINYLGNSTNTDLIVRILPYIEKKSDILKEFNKYINEPWMKPNDEKVRLDKEVLDLLEKYKEELMLAEEFYNGTWNGYEKLQYAASFRSFIKGIKDNIKSLDQLQNCIDTGSGARV